MKSELKISVSQRLGKSYLQQAYCTHPFKLASVGEDKMDPTLYLMIQSSSPGVLDNDEYGLKIDVNENCRLHLQTQSYQRIFRMENGATQTMEVNLAAGSHFHYIPHPVVPHEKAIFRSRNRINMAEGASLTWGEIITCGRKLSGEVFKFTYLRNITEIFRNCHLILKDHLLLYPPENRLQTIGQFEQFTHQATLIYLYKPAIISSLTNLINSYLVNKPNLAAGITQTACNGLLVRLLGESGEQLFHCLQEISALIQKVAVSADELVTSY